MITPRFTLDQDDRQLIITIFAPYTNVKDTEIHVHEDDVRFFSKPYYLRLNLPGKVEETDDSSAKYDSDESKFIIKLDKLTPGEVFPNLNMLTTFLEPKENKKRKKVLIEVMDDENAEESAMSAQEEYNENEWCINQTMEIEGGGGAAAGLLNCYSYGFANNHSGMTSKYDVELGEVSEIQNPDNVSPAERRKLKEEREQSKFSDDHYLSDLMITEEIPRLLEFKFDVTSLSSLTDENRDQMKNIGNREFLLDKTWQKRLHLGLLDILFAYCYDWRTTEGCHNIETPWNISRISSTLSWFETFDDMNEVVVSCFRRSLSYPLYRHWDLSQKVFKDVLKVLKSGKVAILICLLDIHKIFCKKDPYYLLNQLYIEDFCVWAQTLLDSNLTTFRAALKTELSKIEKSSVNFDLPELELAAKLVEDEEMEEEISGNVSKISL